MSNQTPLDDVLRDAKKRENVQSLLKNPNAKKLVELLEQNSGGDLKGMATAAMKGDTSRLADLMNRVMQNPEAAKTMQTLNDELKK